MGQRQSEIIKNHMEVYWHDYASASKGVPITEAGLVEKASVIGRTGLMLLECGTGAWRVRSSMNTLSRELGVTTTADIGLLSIEFTCFDGDQCYTQSLCLTNTGVNTSRLNRLEHFVNDFDREGKFMTGEELHSHLDEIERIHGLYSPIALGFAAALACGCFTFLLGGGIVEMLCAFCGAGIGNFVRCKLTKHHFTLFLGITASVCSASLVYAILLKLAEVLFAVSAQHEAGYICSMLFIIPGFPFITSGIDLAKLDMRSGLERLAYAVLIILVATMTAWIMALLLHLQPVQFPALSLTLPEESKRRSRGWRASVRRSCAASRRAAASWNIRSEKSGNSTKGSDASKKTSKLSGAVRNSTRTDRIATVSRWTGRRATIRSSSANN